jgi:hypothetical protein
VSLNLLDIYQRARQEFGKDINITHDRGWDHPKLADVVLKKWVP